ncbi:MAG TPA: alpha/beta hydrolase [Usitatibacter sp.]|nr:alpha/beta hydrolase [Usitatibacter sp.]
MAALKFLLIAAAIGYVAIATLVWFAQERLLFYPQRPRGEPTAPPGWTLETVEFASRDGTRLVGVLVRPPVDRPPLVLYYGGNAEEVTAYAHDAANTYGERAVLFVNYRGYGASTGRPGEKDMVADALELFDWAARRGDIDGARIALHGRSLGTGVAVQVAAARSAARCVVLTSPFDSARDVAREIYPWLPVALLMRHPFDSLAHAPRLAMPVLILMGDADDLIPHRHSERLADAWGGPVERVAFEGFGHNDLSMHPRYDEAIKTFLGHHL